MAYTTLIAQTAAAATAPAQSTQGYQFVTFMSNVAAGDTVTVKIQLPDGGGAVVAPDINGVTTGLAAANPVRVYAGGSDYVVAKVGVASTAGVYMDVVPVGG